jgi:hypothetical protein
MSWIRLTLPYLRQGDMRLEQWRAATSNYDGELQQLTD